MRNDFRGTGLERTLASEAWHLLVTRTVEPSTSIQIGEGDGQFLETLVDSI